MKKKRSVRIALRRYRNMSQKRPATGVESRERDSITYSMLVYACIGDGVSGTFFRFQCVKLPSNMQYKEKSLLRFQIK